MNQVTSIATFDQSLTGSGQGQVGVRDVNINFTQDAVSRPVNEKLPAIDSNSQDLPDNIAATFGHDLNADAGLSEYTFQLSNNDRFAEVGFYNDAVLLQGPHANAGLYYSTVDLSPIGNDWNDLIDRDATSTQDLDVLNGPGLEQGIFLRPNPANVLPPFSTASAAAGGSTSRNFQCPNCTKAFSRRSDCNRHLLSHNPNATRYSCSSPTCNRQFLRKDKLIDHQRRMRH